MITASGSLLGIIVCYLLLGAICFGLATMAGFTYEVAREFFRGLLDR